VKTVALEAAGRLLHVGVLRDGILTDLAVDRVDRPGMTGAVMLGRVERRLGHGLFVAIPGGTAFLAARTAADRALSPGHTVLVQITADARAEKAAEATRDIALVGAFLILRPLGDGLSLSSRLPPAQKRLWRERLAATGTSGGWIVRAAAVAVPEEAVLAEAARLRHRWTDALARAEAAVPPALLLSAPGIDRRAVLDHPDAARILVADPASLPSTRRWAEEAVPGAGARVGAGGADLPELAAALSLPTTTLPSGGSITIEATRALTAIDVDTGRCPDPLKTDLEAAAAIARHLRLRNIAGIVVIDFVSLPHPSDRAALLGTLRAALADDPVKLSVSDRLSPLGLAELARERRGRALAEFYPAAPSSSS
jgi:ribonuclease G